MGQYKQGLDYFPFTIGLLKDRKLRRPKLKYGCIVNDIYLSLLELIYGDKGYYLPYNSKTKDDIVWEILENLQGKYQPTAETVEEVIEDLVACELFSGDQFKSKILTSKRIQQTYYSATVERKAVDIDFDIWILNEEEMRKLSSKSLILANFLNRSNEYPNRTNDEANRTNERESKVKKSKGKESKVNENAPEREDTHPDKHFRFVPPTLEEVKAYCTERNNAVNAEKFIDFYTAKGWVIGKNKMKNWKAAVRTWENNDTRKTTPVGKSADDEYMKHEYTDEQLKAAVVNLDDWNEGWQ